MAFKTTYSALTLLFLSLPGTIRAPNTEKPVPKPGVKEVWEDYVIGQEELPMIVVEMKRGRLVGRMEKKQEPEPRRITLRRRSPMRRAEPQPAPASGNWFSDATPCIIL